MDKAHADMKRLLTLILVASAIFSIASCNSSSITSKSKAYISTVSGKQGDVLVVINKDYWESALGEMIRETLKDEYPMLPQPEARFRLTNVPHSSFTTMFQVQRNILEIDIDPSNINTVTFRKNVWATPQCVISLKAENYNEAIRLFQANASQIVSVLEGSERERLITNNKAYPSLATEIEVNKMFGGSPVFPKEAKILKQTDDFMWIATCNTDYIKKHLLIYKYPIESISEAMDPESILQHNMKVMNENIPGPQENTYMTHSKYVDPTVQYLKYKNKSLAEIRGLWEVENDYMGGPFITHVLYSPDGKYMIGIEGFVFAPGKDKRNPIRQIDAMLYSLLLPHEVNEVVITAKTINQ